MKAVLTSLENALNEKLVFLEQDKKIITVKTQNSEMIHFDEENIKSYCNMFDECALLIEIENQSPIESEYSLVFYSGLSRLSERMPLIGRVKAKEYQYYDYYNTCEKCTLIITANAFSND